jgi:acyl-coenzyme A thioesterase PaaI-like protein
MGAAAVTFVKGRKVFVANAEMKISFLAPVPPGAVLTCTADVVSGGATVAFVEASIWARVAGGTAGADPADRLVARANSTYILRSRDPG